MFPDIPVEKYLQVGNAAGIGAKHALISGSKRQEAIDLAQRVRYVELAGAPFFMKTFAHAMYLGAG